MIGNGNGSADGQIEVAQRWNNQKQGVHCRNARTHDVDEYGIGICLVGDLDKQPPTPRQIAATQALVAYLEPALPHRRRPRRRPTRISRPPRPSAPASTSRDQLIAATKGSRAADGDRFERAGMSIAIVKHDQLSPVISPRAIRRAHILRRAIDAPHADSPHSELAASSRRTASCKQSDHAQRVGDLAAPEHRPGLVPLEAAHLDPLGSLPARRRLRSARSPGRRRPSSSLTELERCDVATSSSRPAVEPGLLAQLADAPSPRASPTRGIRLRGSPTNRRRADSDTGRPARSGPRRRRARRRRRGS